MNITGQTILEKIGMRVASIYQETEKTNKQIFIKIEGTCK